MGIGANTLRMLMDAGLEGPALVAVVESIEADNAARPRSSGADRQAKYRERKKAARVTSDVTSDVTRNVTSDGLAHVEDKTSNSENTQQEENKKRAGALAFEEFWSAFPNKVGKPKARTAFAAAERKAPPDAIMAGLRRYIASKPAERPWLNPATFLNQERWGDQPATVEPQARGSPPGQRLSPTLVSARRLMDELDAVPPSEIEGNHQAPRLMAIGGRGG